MIDVMKRARSILVLLLAIAATSFAQPAPLSDLDAYALQALKTFEVPGIGVAVVKDGEMVLAKGYGVRKLGESAPVDAHTLFGIASNTDLAITPMK